MAALNELDELPWGGWKDGAGLTARLLGWKLRPFGIRAKKIRLDDGTTANGYEREQFEDAWARYLPETGIKTGTTGTTGFQSQKSAEKEPEQTPSVPVLETPANPHEQRDVPVVPVSMPKTGWGGLSGGDRAPGRARPRGDRGGEVLSKRAPAAARLEKQEAVLSRSDLRELGYERRAIDAIFRACPVVALPGYARPLLRVADFQAFLAEHTFNGRDRVR